MDVDRILPAICASAICFGVWGAIAAVAAFLAHRRTLSAERALGAPALPPGEWAYAWYAGASLVWLSALALAIVGLAKREWARAGRNCMLVFLGHITLVTLVACVVVVLEASGTTARGSPLPMVLLACTIVGASAIAAAVFTFLFAGARAARISAGSASGSPPGIERWAIYLASAVLWPAGIAAAFVYGKPENVRVGATALRISTIQLTLIALAVCAAIVGWVVIAPGL